VRPPHRRRRARRRRRGPGRGGVRTRRRGAIRRRLRLPHRRRRPARLPPGRPDRRRVGKRYQRLIEQSSDQISVLDGEGIIRYQSPSAERVLGYEPDELVGESAFDYVHPNDREETVAEFSQSVTDPEIETRIEYRFQHADGSWRVLESVGRNLLDDPFVEGVVVNSRDVTERRRQEAELRAANERLDQFASVVSHDLRNPLNVAEGHLELVREGHEDSIDEVAESHSRMRRIIEDVLTVAREGEAVEEPDPVVLAAVARDAWEAVDTADATLDTRTESVLQADRSRLQQLLENCIRNAVEHGSTSPRSQTPEDAAEHGGAAVTVTVADAPGGFTVSDDGAGVDDDTLDSMFEESFSTSETGTRLGLAIVQTIAAGHGWRVTADHAPEGGVRLRFDGVTREET
jgi:PAS domain S-box-containing protein